MKITIVAGARPNFMKIAPIIAEIKKKQDENNLTYRLVHTGQHYDKRMSDDFFAQLNIPDPDSNLNAGGGSQAEQTAAIMIGFEKELLHNPSDLVLVVGDVTSTMACSIVAKKSNIKVAHVEAGIRSGDISMPEEVNRIITDAIADYFFTTSETANYNLINCGIPTERIFFVGNTMVDTLLKNYNNFVKPDIWQQIGLRKSEYFVLTLHRPSNVDKEASLNDLLHKINSLSGKLPIIFPVHPRTLQKLCSNKASFENIYITEPLSYLEFNYLVMNSKAVITDSGGITEETTVMGVPCMTLRDSTERPETCTIGTNELLGTDPSALIPAFEKLLGGCWKKGAIPALWDGKAAERIVEILEGMNRNKEDNFKKLVPQISFVTTNL